MKIFDKKKIEKNHALGNLQIISYSSMWDVTEFQSVEISVKWRVRTWIVLFQNYCIITVNVLQGESIIALYGDSYVSIIFSVKGHRSSLSNFEAVFSWIRRERIVLLHTSSNTNQTSDLNYVGFLKNMFRTCLRMPKVQYLVFCWTEC